MLEIQQIITDPNLTFLLLTFGVYGIIFEAVSPGGFVPGIFGAICFITGLLALTMLPINYDGLMLMALGVLFMSSEAFIPSFGILALCGMIAFALGGSSLIDIEVHGFGVSPWVIGGTTLLTLAVTIFIMNIYIKSRKKPVSTGTEGLKGAKGKIINWSELEGEVLSSGAVWKAKSLKPYKLNKDDKIKVIDIEKLCLIIEPENI